MIFLSLSIPFLVLLYMTMNKPAVRKVKQGKTYSVILLDKNGNRIKGYTYIK